jgi:hypothetical protein
MRSGCIPRRVCASALLELTLLSAAAVAQQVVVVGVSPIEGTWRLAAHRAGRDVLRPPQADGFFSVHDGIVLFQLRRMLGDTVFEFYGSGEYSAAGGRFSYGYDRRVSVTRRPTGVEVRDVIPFKGPRLFQAPTGGGGSRYEADGGRYVFEVLGDTLIYSEDGSWLRRWIRVRPAASTP